MIFFFQLLHQEKIGCVQIKEEVGEANCALAQVRNATVHQSCSRCLGLVLIEWWITGLLEGFSLSAVAYLKG